MDLRARERWTNAVFGTALSLVEWALSAQPNLRWSARYDGAGAGAASDYLQHVALDAAGDIYVTGTKNSALFSSDWWTAKLAGLDGALLWEVFNPTAGISEAQGLILGTNSEVFTFAYTFTLGPPPVAALTTRKLAAGDGAILWEHRRPRADRAFSLLHQMAADAAGNVYVLGTSTSADRAVDFLVIGISASGRTLFDITYGEPGLADDSPSAIAVDAAGLPVVGGYVHHPGTQFNWDFGVIRLGPGIFADGFENGDLSAWSAVQP